MPLHSTTSSAREVEDYLFVFAADGVPYRPTRAHLFAALASVEKSPDNPPRLVDFTSMSWLPETMVVRALAMRPEKGRNVPLDETIEFSLKEGRLVFLWGPYRVQPEFAQRFKARVATVESSFKYQGACFLKPLEVCDCVRSVEEMIEPWRRFIGVFGYGAAAASFVVRKFTPWLVEPQQAHSWVETLIGVDKYPLIRRQYGDFTSRLDQMRAALLRA